tara:strand:+ start:359 stop:541 length:183 start_codon:yes stop_codon:yes gene_type:complete
MTKKIIGIRYHYDNHTSEYIDSVSDLSATSVISFRWFNTALTKLSILLQRGPKKHDYKDV